MVTVSGPGIEGEVDLLEWRRRSEEFVFWLPNDFLAGRLPEMPTGNLGPVYIVTWYAVLGAITAEERPQPLIDRVAYYPEAEAVHVREVSGGFDPGDGSDWYLVDQMAAASFSEALERIRENGLSGVAGYAFVTEGTGRGASADWIAESLPGDHNQGAILGERFTTATLVAAFGVLVGLAVWIRPRLYRPDSKT